MLKGERRHTRECNTKVDTKEQEMGIGYSCRLERKKNNEDLAGNFMTQRTFGFRE